jgi:UDP-glucose 4-epimerase
MVLRVNKNVAKEVRKAIKPFTDDCIRIAKLVNFDGKVLTQNITDGTGRGDSASALIDKLGQRSIEELKQALEERREKLMPVIYSNAQGNSWQAFELTAATIRAAVLDIAKYSHKNYFKEVPSPKGKLVDDPNRKYWR